VHHLLIHRICSLYRVSSLSERFSLPGGDVFMVSGYTNVRLCLLNSGREFRQTPDAQLDSCYPIHHFWKILILGALRTLQFRASFFVAL
jgi:hypothetical protein